MKKILLIALAAFTLVACTKTPTGDPKEPTLTRTSEAVMNFGAAGGEGVITYTIENPVEGATVAVDCDSEWISNFEIAEDITFEVLPNTQTEERSEVITVSYLEQSFTVTVNQEGETMPEDNPVFTITSETTLNFSADGGIGEITYTLENPVEGATVAVDCNSEWISNFEIAEEITFDVLPNTQTEERSEVITISYLEQSFTVTVNQEGATENPPADDYVEITANYLNGIYYGTQYSSAYNYYIYLSDIGINGEDKFKPNSNNFRLDIYSDKSTSASSPVLPVGTYTIDNTNSCEAGTVSGMFSAYVIMGESSIDAVQGFESGTVTVTEDKIELVATLTNGLQYKVTYNGTLSFTMP